MDLFNHRWISFQNEMEKQKLTLQKVKELGLNLSSKQRAIK